MGQRAGLDAQVLEGLWCELFRPADQLEVQAQSRQVLLQTVVEFSGNAQTLMFLGIHPCHNQALHFLAGGLQLGNQGLALAQRVPVRLVAWLQALAQSLDGAL